MFRNLQKKTNEYLSRFCQALAGGVGVMLAYLGPVASGVAVATMVIFDRSSRVLSNRSKLVEVRYKELSDERLSVLSQCVRGMKAVKFFAWEESFDALITARRAAETLELREYRAYLGLSARTRRQIFKISSCARASKSGSRLSLRGSLEWYTIEI